MLRACDRNRVHTATRRWLTPMEKLKRDALQIRSPQTQAVILISAPGSYGQSAANTQ